MGGFIRFQGKGHKEMNIYIVREQDMERVKAFTSRKRAVRYLYSWGYHPKVETDMFELWGRD